jgi:hypothetical protein
MLHGHLITLSSHILDLKASMIILPQKVLVSDENPAAVGTLGHLIERISKKV